MSISSDSSSLNSPSKEREEQLLSLFEPMIYELETQVTSVSSAQAELNHQLDNILITVNKIKSTPDLTLVLEDKSKRLLALKRRLTLVHTIVQNVNERCRKLILAHQNQNQNQNQTDAK